MNSKFLFVFLILGLASILVLSGCVSSSADDKQIDSSSKGIVTTKESSIVTEPVAKMKSCLFVVENMQFQYYATNDIVYMKTLDTEDNIFTEQTFTKTETCAKSDGTKGCYDSTEEDFFAILSDVGSGNCTEIDYNKNIFEIK